MGLGFAIVGENKKCFLRTFSDIGLLGNLSMQLSKASTSVLAITRAGQKASKMERIWFGRLYIAHSNNLVVMCAVFSQQKSFSRTGRARASNSETNLPITVRASTNAFRKLGEVLEH